MAVLSLLLGLVLVLPTSPAAHAAVPPTIARTGSVVTADGLPTAQINGVVWTQVAVGNVVFAGGEFTSARPAGAAPGTSERRRWNLISYNLSTGALNAFAPQLNGPVEALALSTSGQTLYVGGSFTKVGSTTRNRFAAFRVSDGVLLPQRPSFNNTVRAFTVSRSAVYAGGEFTSVNGVARTRLAAVNPASGNLLAWAPRADATVEALTLTGDKSKVIAGGSFARINGGISNGMQAVDPVTGVRRRWNINTVVKDFGPDSAILSLAADGDTVYGSGYAFGGGNFEGVFAADDTVGDVRWLQDCHGDTYSVAPAGDVIYSVGHAHFCANIGGFPEFTPRRHQRALAVTKDARGTVAPNSQPGRSYGNFGGYPAPATYNWFPDVNLGTYTGMYQGAWSVVVSGRYVVLGGEFTKVNGVPQQGLVRFALPGSAAPGKQGPVDRSAATAPTVTAGSNGTASVSWLSNWDRDQLKLSYDVLRDGAVIRTVTGNQTFWQRPTRQIIDSGLRAGTTYRYQIRARDNTNSVLSPTTSFTYPSASLRKGAAAAEAEDTSIELWLNTRATDRSVVTYGATPDTEAGTASRELALDGTGRLELALRPDDGSGPVTLRTARPVADGRWHHVVAVQTADGVELYLDGKRTDASAAAPVVADRGQWWVTDGAPTDLAARDGMTVDFSAQEGALTPSQVQQRFQAEDR